MELYFPVKCSADIQTIL